MTHAEDTDDGQSSDRRERTPGDLKERVTISLAALLSVSALVWGISVAWISFRDTVNRELVACSYRHESLVSLVQQYYRERDPWLQRVITLEQHREKLSERIQSNSDRIRDLENATGVKRGP
jgi:flagellar basal body-associated protein FliL